MPLSEAVGLPTREMRLVFNVPTRIRVMQQGRTIIQAEPEEVRRNVTVQEAYRLARKGIGYVIDNGRIRCEGTVAELMVNEEVKRFCGL
jgi:ABC-type branched-subunit amino acid transport system ATPase component